jgi:hypothetical protein
VSYWRNDQQTILISFKEYWILWHRIIPMLTPRMAGAESLERHPASFKRTVFLYGFEPIGTAGRCKTALGAKEWRNTPLVKADDSNKQAGK